MPVLSAKSIQRMVSMCGASLPAKLTRILARYGDHPDALREAGIAYAIDQISYLIAGGVEGIHLYTMNNPDVAKQIAVPPLFLFCGAAQRPPPAVHTLFTEI